MQNKDWKLPEDFYEKNPFDNNMTAGHLSYFRMKTMFDTDLSKKMTEELMPYMDDSRKAEMESEKILIDSLATADEVVNYMRKVKEASNERYLCRKAADMGDEVAELLIEKLNRNGMSKFIETEKTLVVVTEQEKVNREWLLISLV